ncbi:MAG: Phosphoribosyl 1,2-cyclic phosphodiesterase [Chlamydiae bacterium]|nr:Phosphoribosyl 1,2-cyclic phosphodiesterase [Chlamydiota bacterium]
MEAKLLFLGTGGSAGVPVITCKCPVCTSTSQLNKRYRPSALLTMGDKNYLIDVGPDFRDQSLHYGVDHLNGVLLTHTHYDHIGGLDELRVYYFKHKLRLPVLASADTYDELRHRFHYLFKTRQADGTLESQLEFEILDDDFGRVSFQGLDIDYVSYFQANMKVTGFRFGSLAYISDIREYDERVIETLQGIDILVLSALRYTPSEVHFSIEEAIEFCRKTGAKRSFFTHIAHDLEHDETNRKLPKDIRLAHDGLEIEFDL